jgi:hypothetical protein
VGGREEGKANTLDVICLKFQCPYDTYNYTSMNIHLVKYYETDGLMHIET